MRIRDKTSFAIDLILLSVFVAFFFAPHVPQVEWYALGVIAVAAVYSYWQAFFRSPKPWKHYLSRGIIAASLGLVSIAVRRFRHQNDCLRDSSVCSRMCRSYSVAPPS